jgi:hypothetical protein
MALVRGSTVDECTDRISRSALGREGRQSLLAASLPADHGLLGRAKIEGPNLNDSRLATAAAYLS